MKYPVCGKDQKRKDGMTCKYPFVLDPKQSPNISDAAMKKTIKTLSAKGMYYFTFHQLFAQIYRVCRKKTSGYSCGSDSRYFEKLSEERHIIARKFISGKERMTIYERRNIS